MKKDSGLVKAHNRLGSGFNWTSGPAKTMRFYEEVGPIAALATRERFGL